jgi:acetyltransferase
MKAAAMRTKTSVEAVVAEPRPILGGMFAPKSVALIGASEKPGSVGRAITENVQSFDGRVFLLNPSHPTILGQKTFSKISDLPEPVDLAVIATPAATVPGIVAECAAVGVKGAVIISAGFKESGPAGAQLEKQILERYGKMRIIGPNCVGVMLPHIGLNATFAKPLALPGNIGFISQSGALCTAILDWSRSTQLGFSAFISIGSMARQRVASQRIIAARAPGWFHPECSKEKTP